MRRSRRGGHSGLEFGGSGEDSFVAVVVTKLTGALLFILLLTMVIMALLPKVDPNLAGREATTAGAPSGEPLAIATPEVLPDAVAGRPYIVALAATGGHAAPRWHVEGKLPEGLSLDESTGRIAGTPSKPTDEPMTVRISAEEGADMASRSIRLGVLPAIATSVPGVWWKSIRPELALAWRSWMEQGVGFLVLWLVHLLSMNLLTNLQRQSNEQLALAGVAETAHVALRRRFGAYRILVRLTTVTATIGLALWLASFRGPSV